MGQGQALLSAMNTAAPTIVGGRGKGRMKRLKSRKRRMMKEMRGVSEKEKAKGEEEEDKDAEEMGAQGDEDGSADGRGGFEIPDFSKYNIQYCSRPN
eukprot:3601290-Pyramimonas_sp.AAC.1